MFDLAAPETSLGFSYNRALKEWEITRILEGLAIGADESIGTPFTRARFKKKLLRDVGKWLREHGKDGLRFLKPEWRYTLCCARLRMGDFSDYFGWEYRGWNNPDDSAGWAAQLYWQEAWLPKWNGQNCERIVVLGEQGLGDSVFFASIIPEAMVRVREVIYECDPRLHTVLERSLRGLKCRPERDFEDRRADYGKIDGYIPAGELMRMFRRRPEDFPGKAFLRQNQVRLREMEKYRGKVGVSWKGRQGSIDPLKLKRDCDAISLQYNETSEFIKAPHIDLKDDIEGVLALCSVLERVVTVPTTVHHLTGALGVKTQIVLPEIDGENVNQIKWDVPPGKLIWYPDATVYENTRQLPQ